jgi:hypothetical protein
VLNSDGSENASNPNVGKDLTEAEKAEFGGTGSGTPGGWGRKMRRMRGIISRKMDPNLIMRTVLLRQVGKIKILKYGPKPRERILYQTPMGIGKNIKLSSLSIRTQNSTSMRLMIL